MRKLLFIAVASFICSVTGSAQQTSQPASGTTSGAEGLACFENLPTPEYPEKALQEHIDGSVWTWTHVSPQGSVEKVDTQVVSAWSKASKLLAPPVEKAIHAAKIKSECAGKTIPAVFRYQVYGTATHNPKVESHTEKPDIMYILSQPVMTADASPK
jgi:hypothetical protein